MIHTILMIAGLLELGINVYLTHFVTGDVVNKQLVLPATILLAALVTWILGY